jgi:hypothetical protein
MHVWGLRGLWAFSAQACLAVEALASGSAEHKAALAKAGAAAAVDAAKALITNERNKAYPDRALAALA